MLRADQGRGRGVSQAHQTCQGFATGYTGARHASLQGVRGQFGAGASLVPAVDRCAPVFDERVHEFDWRGSPCLI